MRPLLIALVATFALSLFATEPNPSKRQRALIEEYLELTNASGTQRSAMDTVFAQIEKQIVDAASAEGGGPEKVEEAKALFATFREHVAGIDLEGPIREATIRTYARHFSEEELTDLVAFYRTPTGSKSIEVLPQLMREQMETGMVHLGPKIDEAMSKAMEERERTRPWRRTMADLRSVATALEAYATDNDRYPDADYAGLKPLLEPVYIRKFPEQDIWGHAYAYVASPDGTQYRFVSAGSDGVFEWDSRRITPATTDATPVRYRDSLEDDVVFANGGFVQLPVQAKPEFDE